MMEWHRMMFREVSRFGLAALALMLVVGCTSSPRAPAPVETRGASPKVSPPAAAVPAAEAVKVLPGAENAGKPGYYTVQRGDTVTRIALDHGQTWRDLVSWNSLANANLIEVGQVLRVAPPGATVDAGGVVVQPIGSAAPVATPAKPAPAPTTAPSAHDEGLGFAWPASGSVIAGFDEAKNKGLDIAGNAGDPVLAAADGQVVYAGAGLRGYGNLIILKHNNTFLTAYAHNQALLVKEDQKVRKGQKIAEMGKTDADRVKLHFEIRRQGKPVDPAKYLSAR
jgi:lipoprotein NlpD